MTFEFIFKIYFFFCKKLRFTFFSTALMLYFDELFIMIFWTFVLTLNLYNTHITELSFWTMLRKMQLWELKNKKCNKSLLCVVYYTTKIFVAHSVGLNLFKFKNKINWSCDVETDGIITWCFDKYLCKNQIFYILTSMFLIFRRSLQENMFDDLPHS